MVVTTRLSYVDAPAALAQARRRARLTERSYVTVGCAVSRSESPVRGFVRWSKRPSVVCRALLGRWPPAPVLDVPSTDPR